MEANSERQSGPPNWSELSAALAIKLVILRLRTVSNVTPAFCTVLAKPCPSPVNIHSSRILNCVKGKSVLRQIFGAKRAVVAS